MPGPATTEEKIRMLEAAIHDAEWRIGSYAVGTSMAMSDPYIRTQIQKIIVWSEAVIELIKALEVGKIELRTQTKGGK